MVMNRAKNEPFHQRHLPDSVMQVLYLAHLNIKLTISNLAWTGRLGDDARDR